MFAAQLPSAALQIDAIKKAFIASNQLPAANDPEVTEPSDMGHVEAIYRWLAPLEFEYAVKVKVVTHAEGGLTSGVAAQVKQGQVYFLANCISSEKQARDLYRFAVIGLLAVPQYLERKPGLVSSLYNGLTDDQKEVIANRYGLSDEIDQEMLVKLYLAELSALDVTPTFYERRDSFQRSIVRRVWSKLAWNSTDIHYVLYRAAKKLRA